MTIVTFNSLVSTCFLTILNHPLNPARPAQTPLSPQNCHSLKNLLCLLIPQSGEIYHSSHLPQLLKNSSIKTRLHASITPHLCVFFILFPWPSLPDFRAEVSLVLCLLHSTCQGLGKQPVNNEFSWLYWKVRIPTLWCTNFHLRIPKREWTQFHPRVAQDVVTLATRCSSHRPL